MRKVSGWSTVGRLAALCAVTLAARSVGADPTLQVTRTDEARECPDETQLLARALELRSPTAAPASHAYRVAFDRTERGERAVIVDATADRTRTLEDVGPTCAPLGRAVALALATLWSTEQEHPALPPPAPAVTAPPPPPPAPRAPLRWWLSAGGGLSLGLVRSAAPAIVADSAFDSRHFSWAMGALWVPTQTLPLAPGQVHVQLLAASLRGCGWLFDPSHLGLCLRLLGGEVLAQSRGYDFDGQQARPWLAASLEAFLQASLASHLRLRAAAAAIAPLNPPAFSIQNLGYAYTPPPIGALFSLALEVGSP